jgi:zinc protease
MLLIALVAIVTMACPAYAGVGEHVLPNGLKVLVVEDHTSPLVVSQIWYRVGSRDEKSGSTGLSHLLEHMMFKGTEKSGPGEFSREVMRYGGTDNAFTSREYTAFYQILPSDLLLDPEETLLERNVVMEERRRSYEDDPQNALFEHVTGAAFNVHPYRWPVIGWMSDLANIEREDLAEHYRRYYVPANAFFVVAGDVNEAEVVSKISDYFASMEPGPEKRKLRRKEPPQRGERRINLNREAELPYMVAVYHVPPFPEKDSYALEVLAEILMGKSGRLYRSLIHEENLAQNVYAGYGGMYMDPFLFILEATAAPGEYIEDVEDALFSEIELLQNERPTAFELKKAKNRLEASFIMGQDSLFYQAMQLGLHEILGDWRLKDKYIGKIRRVTSDDVRRVARKYLTRDNRTVGILIPEKKAGEK